MLGILNGGKGLAARALSRVSLDQLRADLLRGVGVWLTVLWLLLFLTGVADVRAQQRAECGSPQSPSVGVSFGRSDPYVELSASAVEVETPGSVNEPIRNMSAVPVLSLLAGWAYRF